MLLRIQLAIKGTDSPLSQQGIVSAEVVIILPLQENFHCILLPCVVTLTKYTRDFQLSFIWTTQAQMCILSLKMDSGMFSCMVFAQLLLSELHSHA